MIIKHDKDADEDHYLVIGEKDGGANGVRVYFDRSGSDGATTKLVYKGTFVGSLPDRWMPKLGEEKEI